MRLLFVIENLHPHASAGGYYAPFKFAEALARRGHSTRVYAAQDLGWEARRGGDFRVIYRPRLPRASRVGRKADKILAAACDRLLLERLAGGHRPDWIFGVFRESAIKAAALGRRRGTRVAQFVYECPPWIRAVAGEARFLQDYHGYHRKMWEATREAYLASDLLFPNSELSRSWNERWLEGRAVAPPVYPGIDPAEMPFEPQAGDERYAATRSGVGGAVPRILCVGRLNPTKNVDVLIAAFVALGRPAELHIVGAGPEEGRLRRLAGGRGDVLFHGYLPDRDLWAMYRSTDLVVMPSSFEGFGMPPMQALYFGKPCVASDLPIFRELYGDRLDYVPVADAPALAETLRRLIADPAGRAERGRRGRSHVLARFTWDGAADTIERALVAHPSARRVARTVAAVAGPA